MILNQFKGFNSLTTEVSQTKLAMHDIVIVIHILYKFYEIPLSGYLVMAPDGRTEGRTDGTHALTSHITLIQI